MRSPGPSLQSQTKTFLEQVERTIDKQTIKNQRQKALALDAPHHTAHMTNNFQNKLFLSGSQSGTKGHGVAVRSLENISRNAARHPPCKMAVAFHQLLRTGEGGARRQSAERFL